MTMSDQLRQVPACVVLATVWWGRELPLARHPVAPGHVLAAGQPSEVLGDHPRRQRPAKNAGPAAGPLAGPSARGITPRPQ